MWLLALGACTDGPPRRPGDGCDPVADEPSDDPADWDVPAGAYVPVLSEPRFVVPSPGLPDGLAQAANNNVSLWVDGDPDDGGRVFLAWRTAPSHFASAEARLEVVASADGGETWSREHTVALGTDVREPTLFVHEGRLRLLFFQLGTNPAAFEPQAVWLAERCRAGDWTQAPIERPTTRVPWDVKTRGGELLRTSYTGEHYAELDGGAAALELHLERSPDGGRTWADVGDGPVYEGGSSEAAFELAADGRLWAVTRNEDGDDTGQGAMVCTAPPGDPAAWDCPEESDPQRYDSPELLRHGDDLWLLARRDVGGVFGEDDGLGPYSLRPKRTALYALDRETRVLTAVFDLPSAGDTAFPQARRVGAHEFLVANYTSPLDEPDISWLQGQTSPRGTALYLATLAFVPR